jgi:hypothetical protein
VEIAEAAAAADDELALGLEAGLAARDLAEERPSSSMRAKKRTSKNKPRH